MCHAKNCANPLSPGMTSICDSCAAELERLMVSALTKRIGRPATDEDVEQLLVSIETRQPAPVSAADEFEPSGRCPKCGAELFFGYGLMGGGVGAYEGCTDDDCDYFEKTPDPEEDQSQSCPRVAAKP